MRRPGDVVGVVALALLAGCAWRTTTVVLLPDADGRKTEVTVSDSRGEVVLDQPYAAVKRTPLSTRPYQSSPDEVKATFGAALAAQPRREASFTLHFAEGRDEISDESRAQLESALADIAARPVKDVLVIGHTDRVGSDAVNDALARQRADTVRTELIRRGVAPDNVQASGRGSREPVVPTAAGVAEPRNRRVVIIVR
jgi:outer membrane protein OmpA-like peptidoglycan-associated protein